MHPTMSVAFIPAGLLGPRLSHFSQGDVGKSSCKLGEMQACQAVGQQYFSCVPVKKIQWHVAWAEWDVSVQERVLQATLLHPHHIRFPPPPTYQQAFLKHIITQLERCFGEICDTLYEAYTELISQQHEAAGYKTYYWDEEGRCRWISLLESTNLISGGTTGLVTWQAAQNLAEWAVENAQIFKGKRVLELGSGVGLSGLVITSRCDPHRYTFSDCHALVLDKLKYNVLMNSLSSRGAPNSTPNSKAAARSALCHSGGGDTSETSVVSIGETLTDVEITNKEETSISIKTSGKLEPSTKQERTTEDTSIVNTSIEEALTEKSATSDNETSTETPTKIESSTIQEPSSKGASTEEAPSSEPQETEEAWTEERYGPDGGLARWRLSGTDTVDVLRLDWEVVEEKQLQYLGGEVDVILAADVVYDDSIIPALVRVLKGLLSSPLPPAIYIASTIRNEDTARHFTDALEQASLSASVISAPKLQLFTYDRDTPVRILHIENS